MDSGFLTGQNRTCWNTLPPTLTSYENALKLTSAQSSTFYNYKHELSIEPFTIRFVAVSIDTADTHTKRIMV